MITSTYAIWAILFACVGLAFWLESVTKWGKAIGATLLCVIFGMFFANTPFLVLQSPVYNTVFSTITYLAIVWLLLSVNIASILTVGPTLLLMFFVSCLCTALGACVAFFILGSSIPDIAWQLSGVLTGTYTGGSLNFVGVAHALDFPAAFFSAAAASDNIVTAIWIGLCLILPRVLKPWFADHAVENVSDSVIKEAPLQSVSATVSLVHLTVLCAIGFMVLQVSTWLAHFTPAIPKVIWISSLSLLLAQLTPIQRLKGGFLLGMLGLHLFFVVIGIGSTFSAVLDSGQLIFAYTSIVVVVHAITLLGVGYGLKWDIKPLLVASQAAIGGPSTAMGLAITKRWDALAVPGLLIGLAGYAVGNYLGIGMAFLLKGI